MSAAAEQLAPDEGCTLWDDEIRHLLAASSEITPAVSAAVQAVARALADDDTADAETRDDVRLLLAAMRPASTRRPEMTKPAITRRVIPYLRALTAPG